MYLWFLPKDDLSLLWEQEAIYRFDLFIMDQTYEPRQILFSL